MSEILAFGGWFNSGNLGDKAILEGIKKIFHPHHITTLPDQNLLNLHRNIPYYKYADVVLMTGGTPFYDYSNLRRFVKMVLPHVANKKLILFGVGTKKLNNSFSKQVIRYLINNSHKVFVRDPITKDIFQEIGVVKEIKITGDSALVLTKKDVGFPDGGVAVCPRKLSRDYKKHYHDKVDPHKIRKAFFNLVSNEERQQYLIPFHTEPYDNDLEEMELYDKGEPILKIYSPREMLGVIGHMEHVYGLRLHSIIMAYMMGVPWSTIPYDIKITGFDLLTSSYTQDEILNNITEAKEEVLEVII
jgi:polysaccharide pyruvyl transferase WcaK-like protein